MPDSSNLIPPHGGYKKLVTYRLGELIYDATAAFCARYFDRKDRTGGTPKSTRSPQRG